MNAKHTPGPWRVLPEEVSRNYIRIRGTMLGSRYKVANVLNPDYDDSKGREQDETRANASLMAAAPDLLEALRDLVFQVDRHDAPSWLSLYEAKSAIAKATGESS